MKFLIIIAFVATIAAGHAGTGLNEEQKAKVKQSITECKESIKITEEELAQLKTGELAEDSKCFANCFLEKFGFVKDGAIQEAVILEKFTAIIGEEKAKQIVDLCKGETGANKCETAYKLHKCFRVNKAIPQ